MTPADIKALAYRIYETVNTRNVEVLRELFDPHCIRHVAGRGRDNMERLYTAFPNAHFVVEDVIVEGDKVALRVTIQGVPQHPLPIIMEQFRIENGRVAEIWGAGTLQWPDA